VSKTARFVIAVVSVALALLVPASAFAAFSATTTTDGLATLNFVRCGTGWTGGDSTYSAALPNGSTAWLFSDSFIGRVDASGLRGGASSKFITGNTLVTQATSGAMNTYLTGSSGTTTRSTFNGYPYDTANCPASTYTVPAASSALFKPATCADSNPCWYWAGDMFVDSSNNLRVFLRRYHSTGSGPFDVAWDATAIGTIPTGNLTATPTIVAAPYWNLVQYGSAVTPNVTMKDNQNVDRNYTLVYGMRTEPAPNTRCVGSCAHVARVLNGAVTDPSKWEYYGTLANGTYGWTTDSSKTAPLIASSGSAPQVPNEYSVMQVSSCGGAKCFVLLNNEVTGSFSTKLVARKASSPQGPWSAPIDVYTTPESSQPTLYTYNAHLHPENVNSSGVLVSYNVNSTAPLGDPQSPFTNAANYRPRFVRVLFGW
jgi:hypothetical protein